MPQIQNVLLFKLSSLSCNETVYCQHMLLQLSNPEWQQALPTRATVLNSKAEYHDVCAAVAALC